MQGLGKYVVLSVLAAVVIVPFLIGPTTSQRDQGVLADELSIRFAQAASAAGTDDLSPLPLQAFAQGSPVAVIEIAKLGIQSVVIEGSDSRDTARAIGHLFGTSGPGQEGNAVLVGRSAAFGAEFKDLKSLVDGDKISISTIQGKSEYVVNGALEIPVGGPLAATADNRLTLVTGDPILTSSSMLAVTASIVGSPYVPYPQNPGWLATHPLGDGSFPFAQLLLVLGLVAIIGIGFRISLLYFSKVTVYSIFFPIFLAQSLLAARIVFDFLPPVL
jgi:LPXTG-site transpeptidase (sortase) family protein